MLKSVKAYLKSRKEKYKVPKRVQDLIPINCIWTDGIFRSGTGYSKMYKFKDINYSVAADEDKKTMLDKYCEVIKSLDSNASAQILVNNRKTSKADIMESAFMKHESEDRDKYREEYNQMISGNSIRGTNYIQDRYITITVVKKNIKEARGFFERLKPELEKRFFALDSKLEEVTIEERLRVLHNYYRSDEKESFFFDAKSNIMRGFDFRDSICPDSVEKHSDYLKIGNKYSRVFFLKDLSSFLTDTFVDEVVSRNVDAMFSINIIPITKAESEKVIKNALLGVNTEIANWQRRQNENNNFSATVPYELEKRKEYYEELLILVQREDQRMTQTLITVLISADSKDELEGETESIKSYVSSRSCQLATLTFQQMDGLNTTLPIGAWKLKIFNTLMTNSVVAFVPFKVQEIQDEHGLYYGENAISHNLILCDKAQLLNQSSFVLGVPGAGKSFLVKMIISILILTTKDSILIYDPEGEYVALVKALAKDECCIIDLHAGGKDRLNAMFMVDGYGEDDPIASKSQFVISLIERIIEKDLSSEKRSIVDRCVANVYYEYERTGTVPTFAILREDLLKQPEPQARDIALAIEMYTKGSQDIFGHESNVDLTKRVIVFDTHRLGPSLKSPGMLIITDTILNRVAQSHRSGIRTHVFIDEFHTAFSNDSSALFLDSVWRQFRKRDAYPTGITQNVDFLWNFPLARSMLGNSEIIVMLSQAEQDRERLSKLFNISNTQLAYVTDAEPGSGLIKYGSTLVPFVIHFPKDTELYELMTTKPGEGVFGQAKNKNVC